VTDLGPKRVGLMGGTFDPIHLGHLVCADEAAHQFDLDEVVFIPAGQPWQKASPSDAEDRYMMTMLATESNPRFSVSRIEIDRAGQTFTLDTLRTMREFYEDDVELFFITGADAVLEILTWKQPETVLSLASFIAATRPGHDLGGLADPRFDGRVTAMQIPALAISSTDIRQRVSQGEPINYLVPDRVSSYIIERGLYRSPVGAVNG
jgi:nicotinate-nucleotide adenylyltransferase